MSSASMAPAPSDIARAQSAIAKLRHRIAELQVFRPEEIENRGDPGIAQLSKGVDETLLEIFGADSAEYAQYAAAKAIDTAPYMLGGTPIGLVRHGLEQGRAAAIALLQHAVASLEARFGAMPLVTVAPAARTSVAGAAPPPAAPGGAPSAVRAPAGPVAPSRPAAAIASAATPVAPPPLAAKPAPVAPVPGAAPAFLVVYGAGDPAGEQVAGFLSKTELGTVSRYEAAGGGASDIEALERYAGATFAIVVLPADEGGVALRKPVGRQKALAELFYFIGKLGRSKLCVLSKGENEEPPVAGILCAPFDAYEGWQKILLRALEVAGYRVDWGKALR